MTVNESEFAKGLVQKGTRAIRQFIVELLNAGLSTADLEAIVHSVLVGAAMKKPMPSGKVKVLDMTDLPINVLRNGRHLTGDWKLTKVWLISNQLDKFEARNVASANPITRQFSVADGYSVQAVARSGQFELYDDKNFGCPKAIRSR